MANAKKTPAGTWRIQVYAGQINGKRHYVQFTRGTKREAELAALQWQASRPSRADMTLRQAYEAYCADRDSVLSPSTLREYRRIARTSKSPLMESQLERITNADIQREVNLFARTHSAKTTKNRYGLLTAVLRHFRPEAAYYAAVPKQRKKDVYIPDSEVIARLYEQAKGTWIELPFLLASQCGLRASEVAGLKYDCISANSITIRRAVVASESGFVEKDPKTVSGNRTIPCHPDIIKLMGQGQPGEYVIKGVNRKYIPTQWRRFITRTGEKPFSYHKLRHFFASNALLAGIPKRYVADLMGHKSEHMLDAVYEHVFKNARDQFAERLLKNGVFEQNAGVNAGVNSGDGLE